MSGNIKFIGETSPETVQLPTSGMGGIFGRQSNTKGADNALIKFADSFTEAKTKDQMMAAFPSLGPKIPGKEISKPDRLNILKELLMVESVPKDDQDCSTFIVEKKEARPEFKYEQVLNAYNALPEQLPKKPKSELFAKIPEEDRILLDKNRKANEAMPDFMTRDTEGGQSRRRRRRSSKKAKRSTNKKRKSRRGKRKSYKR